MRPDPARRNGAAALLPWILASALLHAALALPLLLAGPVIPLAEKPPRVLRVQLLREAAEPAPSVAAAPRPVAAAAPPPRAVPVRRPAAAPAVPKPAPAVELAVEPAPAADVGAAAPAASGATARAVGALAAVSAGPPGNGEGGDPLAAYVARVRDAIARHKKYPSLARRRGIEGRVTLRLSIASDGTVSSSTTLGSPPVLLARSALAAVASASPFDPPPSGSLEIEVPIRYALNE